MLSKCLVNMVCACVFHRRSYDPASHACYLHSHHCCFFRCCVVPQTLWDWIRPSRCGDACAARKKIKINLPHTAESQSVFIEPTDSTTSVLSSMSSLQWWEQWMKIVIGNDSNLDSILSVEHVAVASLQSSSLTHLAPISKRWLPIEQ